MNWPEFLAGAAIGGGLLSFVIDRFTSARVDILSRQVDLLEEARRDTLKHLAWLYEQDIFTLKAVQVLNKATQRHGNESEER